MNDKPDVPAGEADDEKPRVPLPGQWSNVMDELIEEAMRDGSFDDLPGRGKPLNLTKNPFSPETELAYQLLKNNNYTLPWIAERNELLDRVDAFRQEIGQMGRRYEIEYRVAHSELVRQALVSGWRDVLASWQVQIGEINKRIADLNLKQPGGQLGEKGLEIVKLRLDQELARAGLSEELE